MKRRLEISQLNTFLAVGETGSLSAAAQLIGRSQAAVSQQIKSLEQTCDCQLFERTTKGVSLTMEGQRLSGYANQMIRLHTETLNAMTESLQKVEIGIGVPDDFSGILLPRLTWLLHTQFPNIRLRLICAPSPVLRSQVDENKLDLAVVTSLCSEGSVDLKHKACWVSRTGRFPTDDRPIPLAISHQDAVDAKIAISTLSDAGLAYDIVCECNSSFALLSAIKSGLAIGILSSLAIPKNDRQLIVQKGQPSLPYLQLDLVANKKTIFPKGLKASISEALDATTE